MHCNQGVHARDLENSEHTGIRRDEGEPPSGLGDRTTGAREHAYARGVEKRALGEIDHGRIAGLGGLQRLLQTGRGCQVELPGDAKHHRSPGHQLDLDVKIVPHAHRERV